MSETNSRARKAGEAMGESIKEMANLMYNKATKRRFYEGLLAVLELAAD
jgi:hypothetical protein